MKTVVIATNNAHKVSEITTALDFEGWEFKTLREAGIESNPAEDADSFEGNARIKARAAREAAGGGVATLADDSGLEVDALGGAPGVYSSRYAGEDGNDAANNAKLLRELEGVAPEKRTARFVCVIAAVLPDGRILMVRQYRNALDRFTLEIPAGKLDAPDEPKIECAARELEEETGFRSENLEFLMTVNTTVAFCDERIGVYIAKDLIPSKQHLDADESIDVEEWEVKDLLDLIYSGKMTDAKTIAAILAYAQKEGIR